MLVSMTGYGKKQYRDKQKTIEAVVQSVNGKFPTVSVGLPRFLNGLEHSIRELVRGSKARGSISVNIGWDEDDVSRLPDNADLRKYYAYLKNMKKEFGLEGNISLEHMLALHRGDSSRRRIPEKMVWKILKPLLVDTLKAWQESRHKEGMRLQRYFKAELKKMVRDVVALQKTDTARLNAKKRALKEKVKKIAGKGISGSGLENAIASEVQRSDITEELERLKSHLELYGVTMDKGKAQGKKLGFILQEMHREVNTLSVKCGHIAFARRAIGLKEAVERMREQALNLE